MVQNTQNKPYDIYIKFDSTKQTLTASGPQARNWLSRVVQYIKHHVTSLATIFCKKTDIAPISKGLQADFAKRIKANNTHADDADLKKALEVVNGILGHIVEKRKNKDTLLAKHLIDVATLFPKPETTKPEETKPAETKPEETKPAESTPPQTQPAPEPQGQTQPPAATSQPEPTKLPEPENAPAAGTEPPQATTPAPEQTTAPAVTSEPQPEQNAAPGKPEEPVVQPEAPKADEQQAGQQQAAAQDEQHTPQETAAAPATPPRPATPPPADADAFPDLDDLGQFPGLEGDNTDAAPAHNNAPSYLDAARQAQEAEEAAEEAARAAEEAEAQEAARLAAEEARKQAEVLAAAQKEAALRKAQRTAREGPVRAKLPKDNPPQRATLSPAPEAATAGEGTKSKKQHKSSGRK